MNCRTITANRLSPLSQPRFLKKPFTISGTARLGAGRSLARIVAKSDRTGLLGTLRVQRRAERKRATGKRDLLLRTTIARIGYRRGKSRSLWSATGKNIWRRYAVVIDNSPTLTTKHYLRDHRVEIINN